MRIKVRRCGATWVVFESVVARSLAMRQRIQLFDTWNEAITEAFYRSEQIKNQCKQS